MNKTIDIFRRSFAIFITAILMFVLAGCSNGDSHKTKEYVNSVRTLVNDSVNKTRILKEQKEKFDCNNSNSSKAYIATLGELSDLYKQLLQTESPDYYDDLDVTLKESAKSALSDITELQSLAKYASEKGDSSLYEKDEKNLYDDYQTNYESLVSLSSEIQTRYRND
ncbi:MAG: hypothetical protein PUG48_03590 [Clostridia bacterium]|nr:hypothetical protein [Clostridia bacterium]